ncbi:MAG: M55 family metallopeptidase [Gemmatimonadota bacterium]|jgi:D-amino peptidase|nr:M55 family metallopeptidase [Gemmatimonadota bacterium]
MIKCQKWLLALVVLLINTTNTYAQQDKLKIYISVDMEGVVGAVTGEQLGPGGFEYQRFREFMTQEVNAAIETAFEAGATEILVSDSHGNGQNLLIDKMPRGVQVIRSWPRHFGMMAGIDETFDGVIFLGYHASTTNPEGVRAHTISSARLAAVRLNGMAMPEAGINAAVAGHFNVPVIMISGDDVAVKEAQDLIGDMEGAVVKWANSFHSARSLHPEDAYELIRQKVKRAIERIDQFKPYKLQTPITLDVTFKSYRPSQVMAFLSIVERTDAHSIRYVGKDMVEVSDFMTFVTSYNIALEP